MGGLGGSRAMMKPLARVDKFRLFEREIEQG